MPRKRKGNPVHGWVVLDKPLTMGSTQAVGKIRWLFQAQKAGHAGTLDPLATGILPIALGEATKTVPFLVDAHKSYAFTIGWGEDRDTWDAEGKITEVSSKRPSSADIVTHLSQFAGNIAQIPPRFSAIKVEGKRSYDLARSGEIVALKSRQVHVSRFELIHNDVDSANFEVDCGKGTYIRSLARDLAHSLGTCGHVTKLQRIRVGPFEIKQSFSLDELEQLHYEGRVLEALRPVETALDDIPVLAITDKDAENLKQGRAIALPNSLKQIPEAAETPQWVLAMRGKQAVALCDPRGGVLAPKRVFNL